MLSPLSGTAYGVASLAFYYYDLITSIVVLTQVWGKWPGWVLFSIFLFHFATTGAIVMYHAIHKAVARRYHQTEHICIFCVCICIISCLCSPLTIPVMLLLHTIAFLRRVLECVGQLALVPCFWWLRPAYLAAFQVNRWVRACNEVGLSWVKLDRYEDMHNLTAAICQSLPTVILNSVLFSFGNKPSQGIFLSGKLFIAAIIASCLAMLKSLCMVLWGAHKRRINPLVYTFGLAIGGTLAGEQPQPMARVELVTNQYVVSGSAPLGSPDIKPSPELSPSQQSMLC